MIATRFRSKLSMERSADSTLVAPVVDEPHAADIGDQLHGVLEAAARRPPRSGRRRHADRADRRPAIVVRRCGPEMNRARSLQRRSAKSDRRSTASVLTTVPRSILPARNNRARRPRRARRPPDRRH